MLVNNERIEALRKEVDSSTSSNGKSLDPVEDGVISEFGSPLRGHVSSSVNGSKGEHSIVTSLDITTNLATDEVLLPVVCNGPVFILNPSLGSICADSHIGIARVLKNLVFVLKVSVNFNRATGELIVILIDVCIAKIPYRGVDRDVELCPHGSVLKISKSWFGIGAWRDKLFIA